MGLGGDTVFGCGAVFRGGVVFAGGVDFACGAGVVVAVAGEGAPVADGGGAFSVIILSMSGSLRSDFQRPTCSVNCILSVAIDLWRDS